MITFSRFCINGFMFNFRLGLILNRLKYRSLLLFGFAARLREDASGSAGSAHLIVSGRPGWAHQLRGTDRDGSSEMQSRP